MAVDTFLNWSINYKISKKNWEEPTFDREIIKFSLTRSNGARRLCPPCRQNTFPRPRYTKEHLMGFLLNLYTLTPPSQMKKQVKRRNFTCHRQDQRFVFTFTIAFWFRFASAVVLTHLVQSHEAQVFGINYMQCINCCASRPENVAVQTKIKKFFRTLTALSLSWQQLSIGIFRCVRTQFPSTKTR